MNHPSLTLATTVREGQRGGRDTRLHGYRLFLARVFWVIVALFEKVGYLYLRRGRWKDTHLIPEDYLEASICAQVLPGNSVVVPDTYSYLWWVSTVGPYASYYALGYGGQTIYVIPALDVVLVTTARWDVAPDLGAGPRTFLLAHDLAERFVLPAVAWS